MNRQLVDIAKRAGVSFDKYGMAISIDGNEADGVDLEKFTYLLLQEAMDMLCLSMEVHTQDEQDLLEHAAAKINKYFGVKDVT